MKTLQEIKNECEEKRFYYKKKELNQSLDLIEKLIAYSYENGYNNLVTPKFIDPLMKPILNKLKEAGYSAHTISGELLNSKTCQFDDEIWDKIIQSNFDINTSAFFKSMSMKTKNQLNAVAFSILNICDEK